MKTPIVYIVLFLYISCSYNSEEELVPDCSENPMTIKTNITDADCELSNGSATINITGGKPSYQYELAGIVQNNNEFTDLAAGKYQVKVTDARDCSAQANFQVLSISGLTATATSTDSGCETDLATITVEGQNGAVPYVYSINNGQQQESNVFGNLPAGDHIIVVTDDNGCLFTLTQTVQSGVSYTETIQPVIINSCAVSGCHNGSQHPDLRMLANIQINKDIIRSRTQSGSMPPGGRTITQQEIDDIACWIDDGTHDN